MKIEIGGGGKVEDGWANLDFRNGEGEWRRKAEDIPWPAPDNSAEQIRASHVMEHIAAGQDRIDVMNEAWRVLEPGGLFEIFVPFMVGSWHAIADPTHISFWCMQSFSYFDGSIKADADYGIKPWNTHTLATRFGWEGHWIGSPDK